MPTFASQDQYASKRLLTHKKFESSLCWYIVNRWDPPTLDPTYDIRVSSAKGVHLAEILPPVTKKQKSAQDVCKVS
jgi:hypothetical protein